VATNAEVDLEKVVLPPGEDFGIPSDYEVDEEQIELSRGFETCIVVDGLPVVPPEKTEKLLGIVRKVFGQVGDMRDGSPYMPMSEDGSTSLGICFIEYDSPGMAQRAINDLNGFGLDKKHIFRVNPFDDIERFAKVPDEYRPPEAQKHSTHDQLHSWLLDRRGRDQFFVRFGTRAQVCWNWAQRKEAEVAYQRDFWADLFLDWSPLGNMIATAHRQGVAVWGGPDFTRLQRFEHPGAQYIQFSRGENYLATMSVVESKRGSKISLKVFNTRTAKLLRLFEGPEEDILPLGLREWPVLQWSGGIDDKYVAKISPAGDAVQVYELPEMTLLDRKSIKLDALKECQWSPRDPMLAAYQAEDATGNRPARVVLIKIPERTEVRQKNLFNVSEARMFWHPQGDYLAVKVERKSKTGKTNTPTFEFFRLNEKDVPMEVMELPVKTHRVFNFAWEPRGNRFCVVHGDGPRHEVSFYTMEGASKAGVGQVTLLNTLKNKQTNQLFWSPGGKNIVMATLGGSAGLLEFFNVEEMASMASEEHFMCVGGAWDPTGRYFASWVDSRHQMENGYEIRSFNGKLLYRESLDAFAQFQWRPRPPSLLSPEEEKQIAKNLKRYAKRFEEEDAALLNEADAEVVRRREEQYEAWATWQQRRNGIPEAREKAVREKYPWVVDMGPYTVQLVEREEVVEVTTQVVG